ncbi:MAG: DUF433 domain-containing protein [Polyangiaceae bacterium]|nr:DUF433 domain-containing protein [Polyangiaceae bacterium]
MAHAALSTTEVVALTGLDERRVRKDVEHGIVAKASPPRFDLADLVYFWAVAELGFDIGVGDRKKLFHLIKDALDAKAVPSRLTVSLITELRFGDLVASVKRRLARFEAWKDKLVLDESILGGEPVFPKSRLAVRHVGGMMINGADVAEVREDYPYLSDEDIEFAKLYAIAYPRLGRPREVATR